MGTLINLAKKLRDTLDRDKTQEGFQLAKGGLGNKVFNTARVADNTMRNNLQKNAGTRSYGQALGQSFLNTPQSMFNSLSRDTSFAAPVTNRFAGITRALTTPLASGFGNYIQGVNKATTAPTTMAKVKGGFQALKGAGQTIAGVSGITPALSALGYVAPQGAGKRLLTGGLRGYTQTDILPETQAKKINTKLGSFDPVIGVGEMIGFVKNPINAKLFKGTEKLLPLAVKGASKTEKALKWAGTNSARGAIEQIILEMPNFPEDVSAKEKALWVANNVGMGALSELVGQGFFQGGGKLNKALKNTKAGKYSEQALAGVADYLATQRRRLTIPVGAGDSRKPLAIDSVIRNIKARLATPTDKKVQQNMGYGSNQAYGAMAGVEPYQDENGQWKVRFNPANAAIGMGVMGGVKAIKGNPQIFGNTKPVKFDGTYKVGDIGQLQKALDDALGTESFNSKGKWTSGFAARNTAKQSLEFDAESSPEARQLLEYVNGLEKQIATAQELKLKPQTTGIDRTQLTGKQLDIPNSKLVQQVQPTPAASVQNKTLRVVPNQPEMPKVPQSAQTSQLPEQPRSVYSQPAQKPKVQTADSWKQLASDKLYSRETADARMADAFDSEMNAPEDFKGAFARFIGNKDAASTRGTGIASQEVFTRVPKEKANDVIRFLDGDMADAPSDVKAFAAPFKKEYERLLIDAQKAGVPVRRWNDYVPHFWKEDPQQVTKMFMSAKGKFKNAKSRTIPTYSEGISMGLTPKYTHPAQILESYAQGLERVKAGMSFMKELDDKGIIVPASVGRLQPGFKQIIAPGVGSNETAILDKTFVGNYYAPTKVADQINRLFTEQEPSAFAKPAAASAKFQDIYLSGGLPGTPINAFTFGQAIKETTAGRPISAVKAVVRSFSPGASNKYFRDKAPIIEAMQKNNIPVQTTLSVETLIDAPSAKKTFGEKIGSAWTKLVNEPTFKRFMPALQIDMFEGVQKGALKAGKSQIEADALAAQTVKAFYGVTGTDVLAKRSPLAKDLMTTTLFAPRFRESMINFWINNAKALAHPGGANKYNTRFLLGAALTYAAYDALNYANTGNHLWENPQYKKDKAMIPVGDGTTIGIPLLPSVAYLPRTIFSIGESLVSADIPAAAGEAMGLLSPLSRPIADLVRNKDYFGKQIVPYDAEGADRFRAAGGYLAQQYSGHPYVRELTDPRNQGDPAYQRISRALEAPLRFYDSKLDGSIKVQAADNSKPLTRVEAVKAEKEKFDKLGKLLDKYENNPEKAIEKAAEQGFSAEDVNYYGIAREDNDVKTAYVLDQLDTIDKSELIDSLAEMRKVVGDKLILADGVIDDLYDQGIVTSAQKKYLKSLDYEIDAKTGKSTLKKSAGTKAKKLKLTSVPKISTPKIKMAKATKISQKLKLSSTATKKLPTKTAKLKLRRDKSDLVAQARSFKVKPITFNKITVRG